MMLEQNQGENLSTSLHKTRSTSRDNMEPRPNNGTLKSKGVGARGRQPLQLRALKITGSHWVKSRLGFSARGSLEAEAIFPSRTASLRTAERGDGRDSYRFANALPRVRFEPSGVRSLCVTQRTWWISASPHRAVSPVFRDPWGLAVRSSGCAAPFRGVPLKRRGAVLPGVRRRRAQCCGSRGRSSLGARPR